MKLKTNKSNASSRVMFSDFLVRVPDYSNTGSVIMFLAIYVPLISGNNMSLCNKQKNNISVEGKVVVVSHVFYMTGKDSKYFFIELQQNGSSKTNQVASCTILARVKDLDRSLLNLQMKNNSSNSLIGKRYGQFLVEINI